jgi:putative oxidoreductase
MVGAGLLIQRLLTGAILLYSGFACLNSKSDCFLPVAKSIAALAGVLLIAGLWTPIAGILVTGVETWLVMSASGSTAIPLVLTILGMTLAMNGPGTWSADAMLYGRKHITFPER